MTILIGLILLAFAGLAWKNPKWAGYVFTALLPVYLIRFAIPVIDLPTTLLEGMIWTWVTIEFLRAIVSKSSAIYWPWLKNGKRPGRSPIKKTIALLLLISLIAVHTATDTTSAIGIWKAYIFEPVIVWSLFTQIYTKQDIPKLLNALGASALVLSLVAIVQYFTGWFLPSPWDVERRVTSLFPYPNALGLFLGPIMSAAPFMIAHTWKTQRGTALAWGAVALTSIVAVVLSQTEAAWIAAPAAIGLVLLIKKRWRVPVVTAGLVFVIIAAIGPWNQTVLEKLTLQDYSGQIRLGQWSETITFLRDGNLLWGAGINAYPTAIAPYHTQSHIEIFQYPHNILLNIWVELGALGVVVFVWLLVVVAKELWKYRDRTDVLAITAALTQMLIHGLVDVPFFKNDLAILTWILLAMVSIYPKSDRKRRAAATPVSSAASIDGPPKKSPAK